MRIFNSAEEIIGRTPLIRLHNIESALSLNCRLTVKLESRNPAGSVKDRAALFMLNAAEEAGILKPDSVIIEPTSGNTGIALAMLSAVRGYRAIIVMPDTMSSERVSLIKAYGAEVVLTDGRGGMGAAIDKAKELCGLFPSAFIPNQFINPNNPAAHRATTGPEIYEDTDGEVDILVAGVGSGGSLSGAGGYLKSKKPSVRVIAVEPKESAVLSEGRAGKHKIQGIGAGFVPENFDRSVCDEIMTVSADEACFAARLLASREGILSGISSGAALFAAIGMAKIRENAGKTIVTILPDGGEKYLSTDLFSSQNNEQT